MNNLDENLQILGGIIATAIYASGRFGDIYFILYYNDKPELAL